MTPKKTLKNTFLVPDYYPDFVCKSGSCRHTCCNGWEVTIPMEQYYFLLGLECSKPLRRTLDLTFKVVDYPTKDRYAEIAHNYNGDCPLLLKNGFCALHSKYGEEVLPGVCRLYPRGVRTLYAYETSCANSCERTLEMLFENQNPLKFVEETLSFPLSDEHMKSSLPDQMSYQSIRKFCFDILQNREYSLKERILKIGKLMIALDTNPQTDYSMVDLSVPQYEKSIEKCVPLLHHISSWLIDYDSSIAEYCQKIQDDYLHQDVQKYYDKALNHFETIFPDHEILFEKMMINDLFFRQFPYQEHTMSYFDEYISLCGLYSFIRYISIHLMIDKNTLEEYIDILARTFRVIAHTKFGKNIMNQLKRFHLATYDSLGVLIQI